MGLGLIRMGGTSLTTNIFLLAGLVVIVSCQFVIVESKCCCQAVNRFDHREIVRKFSDAMMDGRAFLSQEDREAGRIPRWYGEEDSPLKLEYFGGRGGWDYNAPHSYSGLNLQNGCGKGDTVGYYMCSVATNHFEHEVERGRELTGHHFYTKQEGDCSELSEGEEPKEEPVTTQASSSSQPSNAHHPGHQHHRPARLQKWGEGLSHTEQMKQFQKEFKEAGHTPRFHTKGKKSKKEKKKDTKKKKEDI